jgi:hypothetical protein
MTTATAAIAQEILKQSILVGVLAIGAYFFYSDNKSMIQEYKIQTQKQIDELREGIKDCNRRNEMILQNQIEKNTHALERVEECMNQRFRR